MKDTYEKPPLTRKEWWWEVTGNALPPVACFSMKGWWDVLYISYSTPGTPLHPTTNVIVQGWWVAEWLIDDTFIYFKQIATKYYRLFRSPLSIQWQAPTMLFAGQELKMFHSLLQIEVMTPPEVARKFCVMQSTVLDWIKAGRMRAYRIGGRWFVAQHEVDQKFAEMLTPFNASK